MKPLKLLRSVLVILFAFVLLVFLFFAGWNLFAERAYFREFKAEFPMVATEDFNYDEQGIDYDAEAGLYLLSGYMKKGGANPVYCVNAETGELQKTVRLLCEDGTPFNGHAGGLAVSGDYLYIAGSADCCLYVFSRDELLEAEDGAQIRCLGSFSTALNDADGCKVSYVTAYNGVVYVGEFHLPLIKSFRLRDNHQLTTSQGKNSAVIIGFRADESAPLGLEASPCAAYSVPDLTQGVAFDEDGIYLSRSFSVIPSRVCRYEPVAEGSFRIMETEVPLYSLREVSRYWAPPCSEEILIRNDRILIASELYNMLIPGIGKLWGAQNVCSIPKP